MNNVPMVIVPLDPSVNPTRDRRTFVSVLSIVMDSDARLNMMDVFPHPVRTMARVSPTLNLIKCFVFVAKILLVSDVNGKDL